MRVNVGQLCYTINRSYAAFCELDARLRRKYPRCPIPVLPLSGVNLFTASTAKFPFSPSKTSSSSSKKRAEDLRESMSSSPPDDAGYASDGGAIIRTVRRSPVKRKNKDEVIGLTKKQPLNFYLTQLLGLSEVLTSETFCNFIDPDPDMNYSDNNLINTEADVSDLDILLAKEQKISKLILRKHIMTIEVKAGHVIVWSFQTKNHDIGFSCHFNDVEILQYQRYNSHVAPISSCFEVVENGSLKLHWDNSYSKLRSKTVFYVVKVYDKIDYHKAHKLAIEFVKEKQLLSQQREFLKRALIKVANSNLIDAPQKLILLNFHDRDVIHKNDNNISSVLDLDLKDIATLEDEIVRLKDEKSSLQKALAQGESLLIQQNEQTSALEQKVNDLYLINKSIVDETTSLKATVDDQKSIIIELKKEKDKILIENAINSTTTVMNQRRDSLENSVLKYQFIIDDLQNKLNDANTTRESLESQLVQLKVEKKQLRSFAIQLKTQLENKSIHLEVDSEANRNTEVVVSNNIEDNNDRTNDIIDNNDNDEVIIDKSDNIDNDEVIIDKSDNNDNIDNNVEDQSDPSWRVIENDDELSETKIGGICTSTPPVDSKGVPIVTEVKRDSLWF